MGPTRTAGYVDGFRALALARLGREQEGLSVGGPAVLYRTYMLRVLGRLEEGIEYWSGHGRNAMGRWRGWPWSRITGRSSTIRGSSGCSIS